MLQIIRLILVGILFLGSLLTVIKPPTNIFWKLSIVAMEWGHILGVISIVVFLGVNKPGIVNRLLAALSIVSVFLYFSPYYRATKLVSVLDNKFRDAFGVVSGEFSKKEPLTIKELLFGVSYETQQPQVLAYQDANGMMLDFYPAKESNKPCVIVVHGGGWDSGNNKQLPELNSYLSDKGYNVAAINYRLAPKHNYPTVICDVRDAFLYLKRNAEKLKIDSTRFIMLGRSAGGQLALQAAYTFKDPAIKGVISFYAPADMVWGYSVPGNPYIMDSRKVLSNYLGGGCDKYPDKYKESSPVEHIEGGEPPTLIFHGAPDPLVAFEHSRRLNIKLEQAGVPHLLVNLPWATHGYDYNFSGPGSQITIYTIERFLGFIAQSNN